MKRPISKSVLFGTATTCVILVTHFNTYDPTGITSFLTIPAYVVGVLISGNIHLPNAIAVVVTMFVTFTLVWYIWFKARAILRNRRSSDWGTAKGKMSTNS